MSTHPVAVRITSMARERFQRLPFPKEFEEMPGRGILAKLDDMEITVGTFSFCYDTVQMQGEYDFMLLGRQIEGEESMSSCISVDGKIAGVILFSDMVRESVPEMIRRLRENGIESGVLLTGGNENNARKVARDAGIVEFRFELKPGDKLYYIAREMENGKTVVMVGDGIKDAPALTAASVGIAMGVTGSDISSETSDVVVTVDDVTRAADAISIGKRILSIAKQSIIFGMGLSAAFMVVAALGHIIPAEGALIQEVIDIVAIMNSLRASI